MRARHNSVASIAVYLFDRSKDERVRLGEPGTRSQLRVCPSEQVHPFADLSELTVKRRLPDSEQPGGFERFAI
jgi:hypothetical protein